MSYWNTKPNTWWAVEIWRECHDDRQNYDLGWESLSKTGLLFSLFVILLLFGHFSASVFLFLFLVTA